MEKKRNFRKRYWVLGLFLVYVVVCQSCMTMRYSHKKTVAFFAKTKTAFRDSTIFFGDRAIHYIETGDRSKPTLYFVHGSPGSWNAFSTYLSDSLLLTKYRMVAFDRPGFGYSNYGDTEDLSTQSSRLSNAIRILDNGKARVLIGHSMGGPVILKMASLHPDWYSDVVVLAGSVDPQAEEPERWRPVIAAVPLRFLIPGAMRMSNDELWQLKRDLYGLQPNLSKITSNVLVIHGTQDPLVPYKNVVFMERELNHAKTVNTITIPNANHFIPWEHFGEIRDALYRLPLN